MLHLLLLDNLYKKIYKCGAISSIGLGWNKRTTHKFAIQSIKQELK